MSCRGDGPTDQHAVSLPNPLPLLQFLAHFRGILGQRDLSSAPPYRIGGFSRRCTKTAARGVVLVALRYLLPFIDWVLTRLSKKPPPPPA